MDSPPPLALTACFSFNAAGEERSQLQQDANDTLDTRTEHTLEQLLAQELAKLTALDQQEDG
jgi:hypothetical protein